MSHCSPQARIIIDALIKQHNDDTGHFNAFEAVIDHMPGATVIEKEIQMRHNVKSDLRPIVKDLLKAGILRLADKQVSFL